MRDMNRFSPSYFQLLEIDTFELLIYYRQFSWSELHIVIW